MSTSYAAPSALRLIAAAAVAFVVIAAVATPGAARARLAPQGPQRGNTPHVIYSTLLGGADGEFDGASDLAVDPAGNAIVVGTTESSDFPTRNALQDSLEGGSDGFIAKFDANGALVFSTFLGGDERDSVAAVAVDSTGAIYVAGSTNSQDFPVRNGFQMSKAAVADAFVAKLASDGSSIVWASYLGGSGIDSVRRMTVDSTGRVYVTGEVVPLSGGMATFPSVSAAQAEYGGGASDGFLSVISAAGDTLLYSTLFDGGVQSGDTRFGTDRVGSILVDSTTGRVFLAGNVEFDENEPEAPFVGTLTPPGGSWGKVARPSLSGAFFLYTALGHDNGHLNRSEKSIIGSVLYLEVLRGIQFRGSSSDVGAVVLATGYCPDGTPGGSCERAASLLGYDPQLSLVAEADLALLHEFLFDVGTLDRQSAVYIAGDISSDRLSRVNAFQPAFGGNDDVVIAVLEPGTLNKAMVSFLGGDGYDSPTGIATDPDGNIYVCGLTTLSTTFPTTPGALQTAPKGRNDAFLVKISPVGPFAEAPDFALSFDPSTVVVRRGTKVNVTLAIDRVGGFDGNVKVKPPAQVPGFKSPKKQSTVTGSSLALKFKIKSDAPAGPTSFTFTGTDKDGRSRSATITLDVQ